MKAHKWFGVFVIIALMFALLPAAGVSAAGATKVDVCHLDQETGVYHVINISENAFDSHVAHGDAAPEDWVPGQAGKKFGDDCSMIAIEKYTLVDTVTVYPNGVAVPSTKALFTGQNYQLKASGTFTYTGTTWADAEYYYLGNNIVKGDTEGSKPYVLDVSISGYSTNTDWGAYNADHIYYQTIAGAGVPVSFFIYDSVYNDNNGFITVEIYQINW